LGEIADVVGGVTKDSKREGRPDLVEVPYLRVANVQRGRLDLTNLSSIRVPASKATQLELKPGDVLLNEGGDRDKLGRGWVWQGQVLGCIHQNHVYRARIRDNLLHPKLLAWYANEVAHEWFEAKGKQSVNLASISLSMIRTFPVPLPPPHEQRQIVDILEDHLSRLDAAEAGLGAASSRGVRLAGGLFTYHLLGTTETGPRRPSALQPAGVDDGRLAALPVGWQWRRLGELADVVGGATKDAKRQSNPDYVEVPYLRVANVQRGRLDLNRVATIRVPPAKVIALRLQPGDVLLNEGGDRDKLARGWVWEGQVENCIHQNHVFRARVRDDEIDPRLLSWAANTLGAPWAERNGKQSVNLASISLSKIRLMPVPVPPRPVQRSLVQAISRQMEAIEHVTTDLRRVRYRSTALRRSLLEAAFSGRLTGRASDMDRVEEMAGV
jgi:type I restriction enzyme S subunit